MWTKTTLYTLQPSQMTSTIATIRSLKMFKNHVVHKECSIQIRGSCNVVLPFLNHIFAPIRTHIYTSPTPTASTNDMNEPRIRIPSQLHPIVVTITSLYLQLNSTMKTKHRMDLQLRTWRKEDHHLVSPTRLNKLGTCHVLGTWHPSKKLYDLMS